MKKFFGILLIVSVLVQGIKAQDTVRLCGGGPVLSQLCPNSTGLIFIAILNGDTIVEFGGLTTIVPGTQGMMDVYCDNDFGIVDSTIDTSVYFIGSAVPQICVITSDDDNHPVVYVDSSTLYGNDLISLQRQVTTVSWQTVTTFHPSDQLVLIDSTANTATQSYHYKLASSDCEGPQHSTIHLEANGNNLIWNQYQGRLLRGYYINKRDSSGNFTLIDSTASLTYTDLNFHDGDEYFVEAFKDDGCQSNSWQKMGSSPLSVKSNRLKITSTGINTPEQTLLKYYVDGTTLHAELRKADDIWLHDVVGREIAHQHAARLDIRLEPGMYILNAGMKGYKVLIH